VITFYVDADKFDGFRTKIRAWLVANRPTAGMSVFAEDGIIYVTSGSCLHEIIDDLIGDQVLAPTTITYVID